MPARIDSSVVLPAPLGPITATSSPRPADERDAAQGLALAVALDQVAARRARWSPASPPRGRLAESPAVKLLFVGDVVGGIGRRTLAALLPGAARGAPARLRGGQRRERRGRRGHHRARPRASCSTLGVDAITLGNHAYRHREVYEYLDNEPRIVRPANYPKGSPGRGHTVVEADGRAPRRGQPLGPGVPRGRALARSPRPTRCWPSCAAAADAVLVDMHAEATSEKVAMGWHLDGRVTACVGTHTHVPTADARVLPGGTAYMTDVGMTGPRGGVIGVKTRAGARALPDAHAGALRDRRPRTRG